MSDYPDSDSLLYANFELSNFVLKTQLAVLPTTLRIIIEYAINSYL